MSVSNSASRCPCVVEECFRPIHHFFFRFCFPPLAMTLSLTSVEDMKREKTTEKKIASLKKKAQAQFRNFERHSTEYVCFRSSLRNFASALLHQFLSGRLISLFFPSPFYFLFLRWDGTESVPGTLLDTRAVRDRSGCTVLGAASDACVAGQCTLLFPSSLPSASGCLFSQSLSPFVFCSSFGCDVTIPTIIIIRLH